MFLYVHVLKYAYNIHFCNALMFSVQIVIFISNDVDFKIEHVNLQYECTIDRYSKKKVV